MLPLCWVPRPDCSYESVTLVNGGFEELSDNCAAAMRFHDQPGEAVSAILRSDTRAFARMENFQVNPRPRP
jgi:hypothetical protein